MEFNFKKSYKNQYSVNITRPGLAESYVSVWQRYFIHTKKQSCMNFLSFLDEICGPSTT